MSNKTMALTLQLITWFINCVLSSNALPAWATSFAITDKKLYITAVTLSTQENVKLLKQLYSGFKRTLNYINRKYQWRDKTNDSIT